MIRITTKNIDSHRGSLQVDPESLPRDIWRLFDRSAFDHAARSMLVPLDRVISVVDNDLADAMSNSAHKADPRERAFRKMQDAADGKIRGRSPLTARATENGMFELIDGNATAQVLMLAGWVTVPITIVG